MHRPSVVHSLREEMRKLYAKHKKYSRAWINSPLIKIGVYFCPKWKSAKSFFFPARLCKFGLRCVYFFLTLVFSIISIQQQWVRNVKRITILSTRLSFYIFINDVWNGNHKEIVFYFVCCIIILRDSYGINSRNSQLTDNNFLLVFGGFFNFYATKIKSGTFLVMKHTKI